MSELRLLLGVSRDPREVSNSSWAGFLVACRTAINALAGSPQEIRIFEGTTTTVMGIGSVSDPLEASRDDPVIVAPMSGTMITRDGKSLDQDELSAMPDIDSVGSRLSSVCPPFGYLAYERRTERIIAGSDGLGLRHVYFAREGPIALVASSSSLLARILRRDLDESACSVYALLGCFLRERTMFQGIEKLPAGGRADLLEGVVTTTIVEGAVPVAVRRSGLVTALEEATDAGTRTVQQILTSYVEARPRLRLELSGGLDSRLMLAGAESVGMDDISTLTIGDEGSADVGVATALVQARSLHGQFVLFSLLDGWETDEAAARVQRAALFRDFAANPMSSAIHEFVGVQAPVSVQMTGQGGELGRGSYFAGQRVRRQYDAGRAESLVRWRLAVNQAVDSSFLRSDFVALGGRVLRADTWTYFEGLDADWPTVTDQIYLFGRMQRWAGAAYSQMNSQPDLLAPFFHPDYVEWASRLADSIKRGSRAFVAMLDRLDPGLARLPLDSGLTPLQVADTSLRGRSRRLRRDAGRARRKVEQRIRRRRHSPAGTDLLAQHVVREWRREPPANLARIPWLDGGQIDRALSGYAELDTVSVAFLVNLEGASAARG